MSWDQRRTDIAPVKYHVKFGRKRTDLWLRPRTGDLFILHEIFTFTCYGLPHGSVEPVATVVDLGANIGITTLFYLQFFPNAKYVCVEPSPANAAVLRRNVSSLGSQVHVIEAAIDDHSGEAKFDDSGWSWGGHVIHGKDCGRPIRCCTMDDILADSKIAEIDLLKVDVEGAERLLFRNTPPWLSRVRCIIVELHGAYSLADFEHDVTSAGFTVVP